MRALYIIFGVIALVLVAALVRGYVLVSLWDWFIVPIGAPSLGIANALGVSLIVGMFTQHLSNNTKITKTKTASEIAGEIVGVALVGPMIVLFFGWIVTWFM